MKIFKYFLLYLFYIILSANLRKFLKHPKKINETGKLYHMKDNRR